MGLVNLISDVLKSIGVDSTLWWHLLCFAISFGALSQLVFKPYMKAMQEREKRTIGNEESSTRMIEEAGDLHSEYEKRARALNSGIKAQYDSTRADAMKEHDRLLQAARAEANEILNKSRNKIIEEVQSARKSLSSEIPAVSAAIASKLAGKELV